MWGEMLHFSLYLFHFLKNIFFAKFLFLILPVKIISSSNFDLLFKKDIFANPDLTEDNFQILASLRHGGTPPKATHQKSDQLVHPWSQKVESY